jgi:hypothetical protein
VWAKSVTIDLGDTTTFEVTAAVPGLSRIRKPLGAYFRDLQDGLGN